MEFPKVLEELKQERIWVCYPMIWNDTGHGGQGAYDKPPIDPNKLTNGSATKPETWSDYATAAAQIGKTTIIKNGASLVECKIVGVGVCLQGASSLCGIDLDSVVCDGVVTPEAQELVNLMDSYTEISASGTGLHILFKGNKPQGRNKAGGKADANGGRLAEYEFYESGKYLTLSCNVYLNKPAEERTEQAEIAYKKYWHTDAAPIKFHYEKKNQRVTISYARWIEYTKRLSDAELLEAIFKSPKIGARVEALFNGDMTAYGSHHQADQALICYLYNFTCDASRTDALFRQSTICRADASNPRSKANKWNREDYNRKTIAWAQEHFREFVGHIEFSQEDKRAYAKQREAEDLQAFCNSISANKRNTESKSTNNWKI